MLQLVASAPVPKLERVRGRSVCVAGEAFLPVPVTVTACATTAIPSTGLQNRLLPHGDGFSWNVVVVLLLLILLLLLGCAIP